MSSTLSLWHQCLQFLEDKLTPTDYHTWIFPLQAEMLEEGLCLFAPNRFICGYVEDNYLALIKSCLQQCSPHQTPHVVLKMGRKSGSTATAAANAQAEASAPAPSAGPTQHTDEIFSSAFNHFFSVREFE